MLVKVAPAWSEAIGRSVIRALEHGGRVDGLEPRGDAIGPEPGGEAEARSQPRRHRRAVVDEGRERALALPPEVDADQLASRPCDRLALLGPRGGSVGGEEVSLLSSFFTHFGAMIASGTNDIQRNIIAKAVLKLP